MLITNQDKIGLEVYHTLVCLIKPEYEVLEARVRFKVLLKLRWWQMFRRPESYTHGVQGTREFV